MKMHLGYLLIAFWLSGCATTPTASSVKSEKKSFGIFISETVVDVPKSIVGADLVNTIRDTNPGEGVTAIYRFNDAPDLRADLFVYPAGSLSYAEGSRIGQQHFIASMHAAKNADVYEDVEVLEESAFALNIPEAPVVAYKTVLRVKFNGEQAESLAYLAWKQNYFFKLRITASGPKPRDFDRIADEAARDALVRAIALSRGDCAHIDIKLSDAETSSAQQVSDNGAHIVLPKNYTVDQMKDVMLVSMQRMQATGCIAEKPFPEVMQGFQRQTLRFKAGDWGKP